MPALKKYLVPSIHRNVGIFENLWSVRRVHIHQSLVDVTEGQEEFKSKLVNYLVSAINM